MHANERMQSIFVPNTRNMTSALTLPKPTSVALPLSADGGCSLTQAGLQHVQMTDPQLRALDLRNCPDLALIDLRASTQPELHLSVIGCPRLQQIWLPNNGRAYVHIDTDRQKPALQIFGGLAHIDAAWRQGRLDKQAPDGEAWSFAAVGTLAQLQGLPVIETGHGLWVLIETPEQAVLDLNPPASVGEVLMLHSKALKHLRWWGKAQGCLDIRGATALRQIDMFSACDRLTLSACPALALVEGPADLEQNAKLSLHQGSGAAKGLHLNMRFSEATLVDSHVHRLVMFTPQVLRLLRCNALSQIKLSPGCTVECEGYTPPSLRDIATTVLDEGTVLHALARMKAGDAEAWPNLRTILPMASSVKMVPRMLKGLESAMDLGISMREIWETRLELYARHNFPRLQPQQKPSVQQLWQGSQAWNWKMASDLGHDGWRADWRIWQRGVEAGIKGLAKMQPVMLKGLVESPQATAALLPWLLRGEPGQMSFLSAALKLIAAKRRFRDTDGHFRRAANAAAVVEQRTHERMVLAQSARHYLIKTLELDELITALELWLQHDPVGTRVVLLQLDVAPPRHRLNSTAYARFQQMTRTLLLGGRLPATRPQPRATPP